MGIHAFHWEVFDLPLTQFLEILRPEHLPGIQNDSIRLMRIRVREWGSNIDDHAELNEIVSDLQGAGSIDEIRSILDSAVPKSREDVYWDEDLLDLVFGCICHVVLPVPLEGVNMLTSEGIEEASMPIGVPFLQFRYEDCFQVEMSEAGRQMARTLGRDAIWPGEWTEMG